jgi:hypothetical protein
MAAEAGAHAMWRQRETISGGASGLTGALFQSALSSQTATPRDLLHPMLFHGRNGVDRGNGSAISCAVPNCTARLCADASMRLLGGGNGGTKTQTSPTKKITAIRPAVARPVMASLTVKLSGRNRPPSKRCE